MSLGSGYSMRKVLKQGRSKATDCRYITWVLTTDSGYVYGITVTPERKTIYTKGAR